MIGAYGSANEGVRGAIIDALSRMLDGKLTPEQAVADAAKQANAAIDDYNSRHRIATLGMGRRAPLEAF